MKEVLLMKTVQENKTMSLHHKMIETYSSPEHVPQCPYVKEGKASTANEYNYYTDDRILSELAYQQAQKVAQNLLDLGMISNNEFNKLCDINCETFPPLFAEIFPKSLAMNSR